MEGAKAELQSRAREKLRNVSSPVVPSSSQPIQNSSPQINVNDLDFALPIGSSISQPSPQPQPQALYTDDIIVYGNNTEPSKTEEEIIEDEGGLTFDNFATLMNG